MFVICTKSTNKCVLTRCLDYSEGCRDNVSYMHNGIRLLWNSFLNNPFLSRFYAPKGTLGGI